MKKIILLGASIVFSLSLSAQAVRLELNLEQGKTYTQQLTMVTNMVQSVQGMEIPIDMTMTMGTETKVIEVLPDRYRMEMVYKDLKMDMTTPYGGAQYSSSSTADPASQMLSILVDSPFNVVMTKRGEVVEISGLGNFAEKASSIQGMSPEQAAQIAASLEGSFGEEALKNNLGMSVAAFPDRPINVGETWSSSVTSPGMPIEMSMTYTYLSNEGDTRIISTTSFFNTGDTPIEIEESGITMKMKGDGNITGEFVLDKYTGWTRQFAMDMRMKMTTTVPTGAGSPDMEIPMNMNAKITAVGQ